MKTISKMKPQPQPMQDGPRPKPKRSCNQSKSVSSKNSFNSPDKQPGRLFTAFSFKVVGKDLPGFCAMLVCGRSFGLTWQV
jgi:hypothetical protein